jgi:hypothetical protein
LFDGLLVTATHTYGDDDDDEDAEDDDNNERDNDDDNNRGIPLVPDANTCPLPSRDTD